MAGWSSAIRSAGNSQRLGGRGGSLSEGMNFDTRGLQADYRNVAPSGYGRMSPWERFMRSREIEQAQEEQAAAEAMVRNRLEAEKQQSQVQGQLNKAEADQARAVQENLEKEASQGAIEVGKKEANIASRVEEYDEKRAEALARNEEQNATRMDDYRQRQEDRTGDQAANREQNALERARLEAASMAERIQMHEQQQKLAQAKQASAALAKPKGRREAEKLDAQGLPAATTYEPFQVSDQDRPLASAVRMGQAATEGWIQQRAKQLLEANPPAQHTTRPPAPIPFREPAKGRILEDYGPGTLAFGRGQDYELSAEKEWLKQAGPAEYRAYEAWKAGNGPRPASLPQEAAPTPPVAPPREQRAASGRTAAVASSTRSAGLGGSNSAPAGSAAPTPLQAARARQPMSPPAVPTQAPMPAPPTPPPAAVTGPRPPGAAPSIQEGLEAGIPGLAASAGPQPMMPFTPPKTKELIPSYGPSAAIEVKGQGDTPAAYLEQASAQAAKIAKQASPAVAENFLYTKQAEVMGPQQAGLLREARKVVSNAIAAGKAPEEAVALGQAHIATLLAEADDAEKFKASQWFDPSPRGMAALATKLGPPIVVGLLTQSWPFMAAAGLAGSLGSQAITQGTLTPEFSLEETLADTAGAALNTGLAGKVASRFGGGRLAQVAGTAAQGGAENLAVDQGLKALTQGELLTPGEALTSAGLGTAMGGALGYGATGVMKNLRDRALARGARAEVSKLDALARGIESGDEQALRIAKHLEGGSSLDEAVLLEMARSTGEVPKEPGPMQQFEAVHAESPKSEAEGLLDQLQKQAAPPEQARVNERPAGGEVRTVEDVQQMFPRSQVEDLGDGRVRVTDPRLGKAVVVELGKADVALKPGTMEATRGAAEMQPGEYVAGRTATEGPEAKIEVRAGEGRDTAMHEVTHAVEALAERGDLAKGDLDALNAKARFRALAEARRRGMKWNELSASQQANLLAEARADMVGEYAQIKGPGKTATTALDRALAKVNDFVREVRLGETAGNAAERVRTGDVGESLATQAGRKFRKGWNAAEAAVNPLDRDTAALGRAKEDVRFASMSTDRGQGRIVDTTVPKTGTTVPEMGTTVPGEQAALKDRRELAVGGFAGQHDTATGTWGLTGPRGEKLAGKLGEGDALELKTIGKGQAESSRTAIEAARDLARQQGKKWIHLTSREGRDVTPAATKMRDRLVARGEGERLQDGSFKLYVEDYDNAQRMIPRDDLAAGRSSGEFAQRLNGFIARAQKPDGGFSFNPTDASEPTSGYMVSVKPEVAAKPIPASELTPEFINDFVRKNQALLREPGMHVGGWTDPQTGLFHADLSQRVDTPEEAAALGKKHNQLAYFDLAKGESVRLDGGTGEQASISTRRAIDRGKVPEIPARRYQDLSEREEVISRRTGKPFKGSIASPEEMTPGQRIGDFLETESNKKFGVMKGVDLADPETRTQMTKRVMAQADDELKYQIEKTPEAMEWYKKTIGKVEADVRSLYPDLSQTEMRLFKAFLAVTSNGNDVPTNAEYALKIFDHWKRTGEVKFDNDGRAWGRPAIRSGLEMLHSGIQRWGVDGLIERMAQPMTRQEVIDTFGTVAKEFRAAGVDTLEGYQLYGSHAFGPKIGSFFQNLDGNYRPLTADLWWSRSWNRWLGTLFDRDTTGNVIFRPAGDQGMKGGEPSMNEAPRGFGERKLMQEVAEKLARKHGMDVSDMQAVLWFYEQHLWGDLGANVDGGMTYADGVRQAAKRVLGRDLASESGGASAVGPDAGARVPAVRSQGRAPEGARAQPDEQASIRTGERWSGLPQEGLAKEKAARAAGDFRGEELARKERSLASWGSDAWRRATGRSIDRIAEIKTPQGREVGKAVAEQIKARDEHAVRRASQGTATFQRAYDAFAAVTKKNGGDVDASWRKVVDALDGRKAENGRLLVGYGDLSGPEKSLYTVTKAIFKQAKKEAIEAGVFTGQNISSYWPHMRQGAPLEFDEVVKQHAEWLQNDPDGQKRLEKLKDKDDTWLKGIVGDDPTFEELASLDLARNWESDLALAKNPHLEKYRAGILKDYATSPEVVGEYLRGAYQRIAEGRYLGDKAQVVKTAIGQMSQADQAFVRDVFNQSYGGRKPSALGPLGDEVVRSANFLQGLSKLTNAALLQPAQSGVAVAHAVGRLGALPGLRAIANATKHTLGHWGTARTDASRSGATHAADTSETMNAFSGAHSWAERYLTETLGLGKIPGVGRALKTGWFVRDLDRRVRVFADAAGRYTYLEALKAKNVRALTEMLGTKQLAELAIREDLPNIDRLRKALDSGTSGDVAIEGGYFNRTEKTTTPGGEKLTTRQIDAPRASGYSLRDGVDRMDRAGKFLADRTQYRTRPIDAPLVWNTGAMKFFHPFMSFPLQHWYWNKGELSGLRKAVKAGDTQGVKQHLGTLVAYHAVFAPVLGGTLMAMRSYTQGKGTESRQINPYDSTIVKLMDALGPDPIANENWDKKLLALEVLQAWNFAGGIGIPTGMVDRATNAFVSESSRGDTGRAFANAGGANTGTIYDTGVLAKDFVTAVNNWVEGKNSKKDWSAVRRSLWRMTSHVPGVNFPLGIGSSMRARGIAGEKGKTPVSPGWLGLRDEGATWDPKRGVQTRGSEEQRRQNLEDWELADERERESAEASWDEDAA